jgi:PBSX family phage portal protein
MRHALMQDSTVKASSAQGSSAQDSTGQTGAMQGSTMQDSTAQGSMAASAVSGGLVQRGAAQDRLMKAHVIGGAQQRVGGSAGKSQQLQEATWRQAYDSRQVVEPPYDLDALAALYETQAAHKACVDAKVTNIVGLGYRFVPANADQDCAGAHRRLLEHLFANCNPDMTFTEVMRAVWTDVECLGNGYLEITRNSRGQVDGFYHVPAVTVRVRADHDGFVQIREGLRRDFRTVGSPPRADQESGQVQNEILHLYKYTPQSSYYGVPDIIPALASMLGDRAACEFNLDYFEHNAVPRLAIIVEGAQLSEGLLAQIQHYMESEIKGQAHKTLVLEAPGGDTRIRIEPLTVGRHEDAGFVSYRRQNRDEVLMVHRVPPAKVTIIEDSNRANAMDQDKTFREQVVRPEQRRVEFKLNALIREELGIADWELRFAEMELSEELTEAQVARIYASIGALTADEIRHQLGLLPLGEEKTDSTDGAQSAQSSADTPQVEEMGME